MLREHWRIIVVIVIVPAVLGVVLLAPGVLFVIGNTYTHIIITLTSDSAWEDDFAKIPEVAHFIDVYPDYGIAHSVDIVGWKTIYYVSEPRDEQSFHLIVKKSVISQSVIIHAICVTQGQDHAYHVPLDQNHTNHISQDQVIGILEGGGCNRV